MPKKELSQYYGAVYHITARGNNRQTIFFSDENRLKYLALLREGLERFDHQIHGYCLMGNHVHLLIQVANAPIDQIIHNVHSRYAKWVHKKMERVGHLFQDRYKAQHVISRDYLLRLIRYIHLNPVKAGIIFDPADYRWSSHRYYLGLESRNCVFKHWVLDHFSREHELAVSLYNDFVKASMGNDLDDDLIDEIDIINESATNVLIRNPEPFIVELPTRAASLESIAEYVCRRNKIPQKQLQGNSSEHKTVNCRAIIAWLASDLRVATVKNVAAYFFRENSTISKKKRWLEKKYKRQLHKLKEDYLRSINT